MPNQEQLIEETRSPIHEALMAVRRTGAAVAAIVLPVALLVSQGGESHADHGDAQTVQYDRDGDALSPVRTKGELAGFKASTLDNGCRIVAHRGEVGPADENTMRAIRAGLSLRKVAAVEFDVRENRDGKLPLMHDPTLNRTTNKTGPISRASTAKIRSARTRHGSHVPFYGAVGKEIQRNGKWQQFEIKYNMGDTETGRKIVRAVIRAGLEDKTVFTSHIMRNHKILDEVAPNIPHALIISNTEGFPSYERLLFAKRNGVDFVNVNWTEVNTKRVQLLRDFGMGMGTRSVNTYSQLMRVMDVHGGRIGQNAVDSIVTDNSARIASMCARLKPADTDPTPSPTVTPSPTESPTSPSVSPSISPTPSESPTQSPTPTESASSGSAE